MRAGGKHHTLDPRYHGQPVEPTALLFTGLASVLQARGLCQAGIIGELEIVCRDADRDKGQKPPRLLLPRLAKWSSILAFGEVASCATADARSTTAVRRFSLLIPARLLQSQA